MSGDPDTIREITARAQAVIEQDCDMGDDGGPCDDCLAQRALRDDSLWLLDRLAAVEAQRDELARALVDLREAADLYMPNQELRSALKQADEALAAAVDAE